MLSVLQGAQERGEDGREVLEDLVMLSVCTWKGIQRSFIPSTDCICMHIYTIC